MTGKAPPRLKLLFWIIVGCLSTFFAEVLAGSDMFPFFNLWGIMVLIPLYLLHTLILAYVVALPIKNVVAWWVNGRVILPFRIYWWQTVIAPLLAGLVNWALLRALGTAMGGDEVDQITAVILFFIALLPSLPIFCFLDGLFGGWDNAGLAELRRAAGLSSLGKPIAWLIYHASALGARLSPLHGRFPVELYETAQAEARTLTEERVSLVGMDS